MTETHAWQPPAAPDVGPAGTAPGKPGSYKSALLNDHGDALAAACTRRFYAMWPQLLARYGEHGRVHTHNDQYWHLAHLDGALAGGSPATFAAYVAWLRTFLAGRGMGDAITAVNFAWLHEDVAALADVDAAEQAAILACLRAALAVFEPFPPAASASAGPYA